MPPDGKTPLERTSEVKPAPSQIIEHCRQATWGQLAQRTGLPSNSTTYEIYQTIASNQNITWVKLAGEIGLTLNGTDSLYSQIAKYYNSLWRQAVAERLGMDSESEWDEIDDSLMR